jgi:hypothetical protein
VEKVSNDGPTPMSSVSDPHHIGITCTGLLPVSYHFKPVSHWFPTGLHGHLIAIIREETGVMPVETYDTGGKPVIRNRWESSGMPVETGRRPVEKVSNDGPTPMSSFSDRYHIGITCTETDATAPSDIRIIGFVPVSYRSPIIFNRSPTSL